MSRLMIAAPGIWLMALSMVYGDDLAQFKKYQYGADQTHLLAVERRVEQSMADPAKQAELAGRLLKAMADSNTTLPAKQHAAIFLRMCATEAEVPGLAAMLGQEPLGQWARQSLERNPTPAAGRALRDALKRLRGAALIGVIHATANRGDRDAVDALIPLTGSEDGQVASAATRALGRIGGLKAVECLRKRLAISPEAVDAYLACGILAMQAQDKTLAASVFATLADSKFPAPIRRAALTGQLMTAGDPTALVAAWLTGTDTAASRVAANHLTAQPTERLVTLCRGAPLRRAILPAEALASRGEKTALPILQETVRQQEDPVLRMRGILAMASVADQSILPLLIARLDGEPSVVRAAIHTLSTTPCALVEAAVIDAYKDSTFQRRATVVQVMVARRMVGAVPVLLESLKANQDPALRDAVSTALVALGDEQTLTRLVEIVLALPEGNHREKTEATYLKIAEKHRNTADPIVAAMKDDTSTARLLPLLGRVGGKKALQKIDEALASTKEDVKEAGIRALCSLPDPSIAQRLVQLYNQEKDPQVRIVLLRGYIQMASPKDNDPTEKSLHMLKWAFQVAQRPEEKNLAAHRARNVRGIETLRWLVTLLDNDAVAQEACRSIVDLAHHRGLRNPNREEFAKALQKVIGVSKDPKTVERAKGYLEGV